MDTMEDWACKVIQKSSLTKQRNQDLQSEIEILRSISHRHVVRLEDVFEDKENVYIIMQVLDAVRHMHQRNIIHRDLKLGNFFLCKDGEIKVGDFGFACKLKFDGERKTTRCGTPNYVAPEMLDGKGHSFEVDVWSIGVAWYSTRALLASQYSLFKRYQKGPLLGEGARGVVLYTCLVGKPILAWYSTRALLASLPSRPLTRS
jgi:serine/threonine protein kinase